MLSSNCNPRKINQFIIKLKSKTELSIIIIKITNQNRREERLGRKLAITISLSLILLPQSAIEIEIISLCVIPEILLLFFFQPHAPPTNVRSISWFIQSSVDEGFEFQVSQEIIRIFFLDKHSSLSSSIPNLNFATWTLDTSQLFFFSFAERKFIFENPHYDHPITFLYFTCETHPKTLETPLNWLSN